MPESDPTMPINRPEIKPQRPYFSSGPCAKPPNWEASRLGSAQIGRSHRGKLVKTELKRAIDRTRQLLSIPVDYKIGIVAGSDTGAFEMALWSMLGARQVEAMAFEAFGSDWLNDIKTELKLEDARLRTCAYGEICDLNDLDPHADIVFTWNGTTGGVRVPDGNWITDDRQGLTFCDATSAVFAYPMPWEKLDVTTWSWQKVLGGEAAHGMLVLSPRAVERLEHYTPSWPLPKLFRLTKKGKLNDAIFEGATINTPSMLCVEDLHFSYDWVDQLGGVEVLYARSAQSLAYIADFVDQTPWLDFLCQDANIRSSTGICLTINDQCPLTGEEKETLPAKITKLLEEEHIAYDINGYRDAPSGLRIWGGGTVDPDDIKALMPWIDWAYHQFVTH